MERRIYLGRPAVKGFVCGLSVSLLACFVPNCFKLLTYGLPYP